MNELHHSTRHFFWHKYFEVFKRIFWIIRFYFILYRVKQNFSLKFIKSIGNLSLFNSLSLSHFSWHQQLFYSTNFSSFFRTVSKFVSRAPYRAGPLVGLSVGLSFGPGRVETFNPLILSGQARVGSGFKWY